VSKRPMKCTASGVPVTSARIRAVESTCCLQPDEVDPTIAARRVRVEGARFTTAENVADGDRIARMTRGRLWCERGYFTRVDVACTMGLVPRGACSDSGGRDASAKATDSAPVAPEPDGGDAGASCLLVVTTSHVTNDNPYRSMVSVTYAVIGVVGVAMAPGAEPAAGGGAPERGAASAEMARVA
jgi:hypothetical protein